MAVTSQKITHTPLHGSGLSIPDANKQREFARWVEAKSVRNTQFTDWLKRGSEFGQIDIEIGQSYAPFIATTLGAQAGNGDEQLTAVTTALIRVGDQGYLEDYFASSTTELDNTTRERFTVLSVDSATLFTVERHEGEVADGSYNVHPSGSVVRITSRAQNYNEPFPDAITYRGDSITVHTQILDSGEITYALSAARTADFEAPGGHYARDVMFWKNELPYMRNDAFINGRKRTGNYTSSPKIPYRLSGAIWFAEQVGANVTAINGLLNFFDFTDIYEDLATNHQDGPGDTIWMAPRMFGIYNTLMWPYKGMFGANDTTLDMRVTRVKDAFGTTDGIKWDNQWPSSKILLTSRADWYYGNMQDFDWTYVERGPKELGAFSKSWTMGGEWGLVCTNITHQRLLTGLETRRNLYRQQSSFQ